jgi:hypothetical protein
MRVSQHLDRATSPVPSTSNAACGLPALRSHLLHAETYGTYPAGATFSMHPALAGIGGLKLSDAVEKGFA